MPEIIAATFMGCLFFGIPLVIILTKHQQKMTSLIHGVDSKGRHMGVDASTAALHHELATLKEIVHQQTIAIDNLTRAQAQLQTALAERTELSERVGA